MLIALAQLQFIKNSQGYLEGSRAIFGPEKGPKSPKIKIFTKYNMGLLGLVPAISVPNFRKIWQLLTQQYPEISTEPVNLTLPWPSPNFSNFHRLIIGYITHIRDIYRTSSTHFGDIYRTSYIVNKYICMTLHNSGYIVNSGNSGNSGNTYHFI